MPLHPAEPAPDAAVCRHDLAAWVLVAHLDAAADDDDDAAAEESHC